MLIPDYRTDIEPHHIQKFKSDFEHVFQTNGSVLREHVNVVSEEGEGATAVHFFGKSTIRRDGTPFRANPLSQTPRQRVWYAPNPDIEWGEPIETRDMLLQARNPSSDLMHAGTMAIGRALDEDIVAGMIGNRMLGKNFQSATANPHPATQEINIQTGSPGAAADQPMNLEKLRTAWTLFGQNRVDLMREKPLLAITSKQHEDLTRFTELASSDFYTSDTERPYYEGGILRRAMGFNFVLYEDLPLAAGIRTCLAWVKREVQLGEWQSLKPDMWGLPENRNIPYCYASTIVGVTRKQNEGVIRLPCAET